VVLPCSGGNGNCSTPTCAACEPSLSGIRPDSSCPSGSRNVCWTGGSCPNTGDCVPVPDVPVPGLTFCPSLGFLVPTSGFPGNCPGAGTTTTTTAAPIFVTTTAGPVVCSGPCNGTWSVVNGTCRCTATTTPRPTTTTTAAPTTSRTCLCRDFRGRCLTARQCGLD
jgi:hypothetical protein